MLVEVASLLLLPYIFGKTRVKGYRLGRDFCQETLKRPFNKSLQDECHDAMHLLPKFDSENEVKAWFLYDFNVTGPLGRREVFTIRHEVYLATWQEDSW